MIAQRRPILHPQNCACPRPDAKLGQNEPAARGIARLGEDLDQPGLERGGAGKRIGKDFSGLRKNRGIGFGHESSTCS